MNKLPYGPGWPLGHVKYGLQMRLLDLVSWIGGRIGRQVVVEVVLSRKNTPSLLFTTRTSN